jgi:hypothetical protein
MVPVFLLNLVILISSKGGTSLKQWQAIWYLLQRKIVNGNNITMVSFNYYGKTARDLLTLPEH